MNIYGISDLHLSGQPPFKPMIHFGQQYDRHMERLEAGFKSLPSGSIVINAGDISWAIDREEALVDLQWLNSFGVKIVNTIGNHDYFWGKKGASFMSNWALDNGLDNLYFVDHQQPFLLDQGGKGVSMIATKGCEEMEQLEIEFDVANLPPGHKPKLVNQKNWDKYVRRLEAVLAFETDILVSHIPPFRVDGTPNQMTEMINKSKVNMILFGHRHNAASCRYDNAVVDGKIWINVLCERMDFMPKLIYTDGDYSFGTMYA